MDFLGLLLEKPSQDIWLMASMKFSHQRREGASRDGALQKVGGIDDGSEAEQHEGPALLKVNARR